MTTVEQETAAVAQRGPATGLRTTPSRWWRQLPLIPAVVLLLAAIVGPWVVPFSPTEVVAKPYLRPGSAHWFGTDSSGLDVFSRTIASARNDLLISLSTTVLATALGIILGLVIGINESRRGPFGIAARALARVIDLVQAVPAIVIGMVLVAFFGTSVPSLVIALMVILTPNQARLVRTEVLQVRSEPYLDAARMAGERELKLVVRHILPNAAWPALENTTLVFAAALLLTAALGFLGIGLAPPTPEWGSMITTGATSAAVGKWWPGLFPAIAMAMSVISAAVVGHRLFGRNSTS